MDGWMDEKEIDLSQSFKVVMKLNISEVLVAKSHKT